MESYDLIIVGAGPAGLTAAVYAGRYKLKTLVIGKTIGGIASKAYEICNFPTYTKIIGFEFMQKLISQVKDIGIQIKAEEVEEVKKDKHEFKVITNRGGYNCKRVILALGSKRKKLEIEREDELTGKGISYCATCDAPFYKDKVVGVVGGSDAALTTSLLLAKFAKKVYIIYRQDKFYRAEPAWIDDVKKNSKITPVFNSQVIKLFGKEHLEEIEMEKNGKKEKMKLDGIFIEIGSDPNIKLPDKMGIKLDGDYIDTDKKQRTSIKGIFAAGDITNNPLKQIVTACAEGAIASDTIYRELMKEE